MQIPPLRIAKQLRRVAGDFRDAGSGSAGGEPLPDLETVTRAGCLPQNRQGKSFTWSFGANRAMCAS